MCKSVSETVAKTIAEIISPVEKFCDGLIEELRIARDEISSLKAELSIREDHLEDLRKIFGVKTPVSRRPK